MTYATMILFHQIWINETDIIGAMAPRIYP